MDTVSILAELQKTLEAGGYNAAPSTLTQGSALQIENLDGVMHNVTFSDEHIKLQKMVSKGPCKSTLVQFDRQLSYGIFGGSAQSEGQVGQFEDSDFVRVTVPMAFYSHLRRVTLAANMVQTVDGKKAEDRAAADAAMKIAGDVEFDLFRGKADFSNAGVFDGNPLAIPALPNMLGLDPQVRQSDALSNTQDLMFAEFGSDLSVVIAGGGILTQSNIEDAWVRTLMNMGKADSLMIDPLVASAYSKSQSSIQRNFLSTGSALGAVGQDIHKQFVAGGTIKLEVSRFLSGKFKPQRARATGPVAPTLSTGQSAGSTAFVSGQVYNYTVTAVNEIGESAASAASAVTIASTGNFVTLTITPGSGTNRYFNVYRTNAGAAAATARFIGRVTNSGAGTTTFTDLGNKLPGAITGFLVQGDTMKIHELAAYSRLPIAIQDLTKAEAHFRFLTLAVMQPRKNVLLDNLIGAL